MDFIPKILYHDKDILLCRKPHGIASSWGQEVSFLDSIKKISSDDTIRSHQMSVFGEKWEYGLLCKIVWSQRTVYSSSRAMIDHKDLLCTSLWDTKVTIWMDYDSDLSLSWWCHSYDDWSREMKMKATGSGDVLGSSRRASSRGISL